MSGAIMNKVWDLFKMPAEDKEWRRKKILWKKKQ